MGGVVGRGGGAPATTTTTTTTTTTATAFFKFLRHDRELMQAPQSEKGRPWGIFVGLSGRDPIES